mgnify:CR=1 FL=1
MLEIKLIYLQETVQEFLNDELFKRENLDIG